MLESDMLELGKMAKDCITGFKGIITAKAVYLNGCVSYQLTSKNLTKDGAEITQWFDEQRLTEESKAKTGGPQDRPPSLHP